MPTSTPVINPGQTLQPCVKSVTCLKSYVRPPFGRFRPGIKVICVGDSLTSGVVNAPWFTALKAECDAFYTARSLTLPTWVNLGAGGTGSVYMRDTAPALINAESPGPNDLVIIQYGINDINNGSVGPLANHLSNMNDGIDAITGSPQLMLCGPWVREETTYAADIQAMSAGQAQICVERNAAFVDWRAYWDAATTAERTGLVQDGTHPTHPAGNAWLSDKTRFQVVFQES